MPLTIFTTPGISPLLRALSTAFLRLSGWQRAGQRPADFAAWSQTLRKAHPRWHHVRWDDADNREFIRRHHAWFLPAYDAYPRVMASRSRQAFWLWLMWLMARATREGRAQGASVEGMTGPILLEQAHDLYVSPADAADVKAAIREVAGHYGDDMQPAPAASRLRVLPPQAWYPVDWSNVVHAHFETELKRCALTRPAFVKRWLFPQSTLVTYWSHSWGQ